MQTRNRSALLAVAASLLLAPTARADYFNPGSFASLGVLNLASGDYTIETNGAPVLRDSSNNVIYTGTTVFQGGTFRDTVAVLAFSSINIASGVNIRAFGANPLALLSQSDVVFNGVLNANGDAGADSARFGGSGQGGAGGPGGGKGGNGGGFPGQTGEGPGGGPGGPGGIGVVQAAGGSFGGRGGQNALGLFGEVYGNLNLLLQGGSGGGGTGASAFESVGAGGGGAGGGVEIGALGNITFGGGDLTANGGGVGRAFAANAGGGSGGGLLIHAPTINVQTGSVISAQGGSFFGGGGRILFLTNDATINQTGGSISVAPGGGANNQQPGVIEYGYLTAAVPEPSPLALAAVGGLGTLLLARRRKASSPRTRNR